MAEGQDEHKWFASVYDRLTAFSELSHVKLAREEIVGGARGRVLEVGAGTGASFPYYSDHAEQIIATEPNSHMLGRALRRAEEVGRPIELWQAAMEELPFDEASFDTVVSMLVMCTVSEPLRALSEVRRVLNPTGELRVYEHVRYDHAFGAFWQDLTAPAWRWFGGGCHPNRNTAGLIREAGFEFQELELIKPAPPIPPWVLTRPHIKGVARPS